MKILVTSGATREPLDAVRYLSNASTGATGAALADALTARGHAVTLLPSAGAITPHSARALHAFSSTKDLHTRLKRLLATGGFDAVVHCAAVADYAPARVARGKMSSARRAFALRLVPTPKILPQIQSFAPRPPLVIGFKLTAGVNARARTAAVARLFSSGTVDAVVHNEAAQLAAGHARPFRAYVAGRARPALLAGVPALAAWLHEFVTCPPRED